MVDAGGVPFDVEAGGGELCDESVELFEGGERVDGGGRVVGLAHHVEDAAEFVEHAAGSSAYVVEGLLGAGWVCEEGGVAWNHCWDRGSVAA